MLEMSSPAFTTLRVRAAWSIALLCLPCVSYGFEGRGVRNGGWRRVQEGAAPDDIGDPLTGDFGGEAADNVQWVVVIIVVFFAVACCAGACRFVSRKTGVSDAVGMDPRTRSELTFRQRFPLETLAPPPSTLSASMAKPPALGFLGPVVGLDGSTGHDVRFHGSNGQLVSFVAPDYREESTGMDLVHVPTSTRIDVDHLEEAKPMAGAGTSNRSAGAQGTAQRPDSSATWLTVQASRPLAPAELTTKLSPVYFEVRVLKLERAAAVALGWAARPHHPTHAVGFDDPGFALHSTGYAHLGERRQRYQLMERPIRAGDTVGVGYALSVHRPSSVRRDVHLYKAPPPTIRFFWTLNGRELPSIPDGKALFFLREVAAGAPKPGICLARGCAHPTISATGNATVGLNWHGPFMWQPAGGFGDRRDVGSGHGDYGYNEQQGGHDWGTPHGIGGAKAVSASSVAARRQEDELRALPYGYAFPDMDGDRAVKLEATRAITQYRQASTAASPGGRAFRHDDAPQRPRRGAEEKAVADPAGLLDHSPLVETQKQRLKAAALAVTASVRLSAGLRATPEETAENAALVHVAGARDYRRVEGRSRERLQRTAAEPPSGGRDLDALGAQLGIQDTDLLAAATGDARDSDEDGSRPSKARKKSKKSKKKTKKKKKKKKKKSKSKKSKRDDGDRGSAAASSADEGVPAAALNRVRWDDEDPREALP